MIDRFVAQQSKDDETFLYPGVPRQMPISLEVLIGVLVTLVSVTGWTDDGISRGQTVTSSTSAALDDQTTDLKPLTVEDSIEMVHMSDPWEDGKNNHPAFSPDGLSFLVTTAKGNVTTNLREYELLQYFVNDLRSVVHLAIFRSSSNRPGISQVKWLTSDKVSFVGEQPGETPQLYIVNCKTQRIDKITADKMGLLSYDLSEDLRTAIYTARSPVEEASVNYRDQHGFAVSYEQLYDLSSGEWKTPRLLFQTHVLDVASGRTVQVEGGSFAALPGRCRLWMSPNGQYAITERPAFPIPGTWDSYEDQALANAVRSVRASVHSQQELHWLGQVMLIHTATGQIEPLVDAPLVLSYGMTAVWSPDSRSVVVAGTYLPVTGRTTDELSRSRTLPVVAEFRVPTKSFRRIADIPGKQMWFVEPAEEPGAVLIRTDGQEATRNSGTPPTLLYRRNGDEWTRTVGAPTIERPVDVTVRQALDQWPKLVALNRVTHREQVLMDPNPQFHYRRFGRTQIVHWKTNSGESSVGGLVYPVDYSPGIRYPLVIQTHDFDPDLFLLDGPFTTAMAAQELANKGIMVLQIGEAPRYEQTVSTTEEGPYNMSVLQSAIDYLDHDGFIDRNRVGLIGFSRTAYHIKYCLTHSRYHFAAAIAAEGIDFGYWQYIGVYGSDALALGEYNSMYGGNPWRAGWKLWEERSITFDLEKIDTPLRLEANDNPGAIIAEWETFIALRLLGRPVELIFIPHGDHPLVKPWERMTSQQGTVDWFTFWLKNEEDPDPAKRGQYERWHKLRELQEQTQKRPGEALPTVPRR